MLQNKRNIDSRLCTYLMKYMASPTLTPSPDFSFARKIPTHSMFTFVYYYYYKVTFPFPR